MLDSLYTYLIEGSIYYGLEVSQFLDGERYRLLKVERKKQELVISKAETYNTLEDIAGTLPQGTSVILIINTNEVITKIVANSPIMNIEAEVHQAFPNLDLDDFYYELLQTNENSLVSICRKQIANRYFEKLSELKINPLSIFLGVSTITSITKYINTNKLYVSTKLIGLEKGVVHKIYPDSIDQFDTLEQYDVNGLSVNKNYILGLSGVLGYLLKSFETQGNLQKTKKSYYQEFVYKRNFKLILKSSLISILCLLFLNFLFFNYYFEKVESLKVSLTSTSQSKENLIKLKAKVKVKTDHVNELLALSKSHASYLLDEIATTVPKSILLTELLYQPLEQPIRESKLIAIKNNTIIVSGQVDSNEDFYSWIEVMEKFKWIDHIEIANYEYRTKEHSDFSIKLFLDE